MISLAVGSISSPKYKNEPNTFDIVKMYQRNSSYIDESNKSCKTDDCECVEGELEKSSSEHTLFSVELLDRVRYPFLKLTNYLLHIMNICIVFNQFLQITPEEGQISPYTEQSICFTFNGYENIKVSAQAVCEITCGSSQIINVTATADTVRCRVEDYVLDYGLQVRTHLKLLDHSKLDF